VLGKFACRVCSKIVGIGSAERTWGTVKHLKTDKRAHLSPEAVEKQATIFGASGMIDAEIDRDNSGPIKFWHDNDFDKQFDMLALAQPIPPSQRILKCYLEEWEREHLFNKSAVSKAKFLRKYGGWNSTISIMAFISKSVARKCISNAIPRMMQGDGM
jgi:hypothetical protein